MAYSLGDNFPKDIAFRCRLLYIIIKAAKQSGDYQTVNEDLLLRDWTNCTSKIYRDTLLKHTLPRKLHPQTFSFKQGDRRLAQ